MFNGYNETPLISYNDFDQEKKQENVSKWSYGPDASVQLGQHHSNNRQSEFWSPKSSLIGIPNVVHIPSKCNCSGCYSSPENQSYQGDSTRHRPWLPRTFPVPLNSSNESCKLPGYHQWDNVGLSSQTPCFSESNALHSQYLQENGGKHSYYRPYQNSRLPEPNQPGVITSVKNSDFVKKDVLLKQKDEMSANSTTEMSFFGQNGTKQPIFCNPTYNLARNMEKRIDNRNCSSSYCDPSDKYSALDSCRHPTNVASYPLEQHISRLPVVEPYIKAVPSNLNQNRVPSTGHRSLKETKPQSYLDQSYSDSRKLICSQANQAVNGNKNGRPVYHTPVAKEGSSVENFQSGQLHNMASPMAMNLKSGVHIDYSHFNANRDLSKSCANMAESETQKFMFESNRHPDFFPRNSLSDVIKRNNQVPLLDNKKDCAITQIGQMNMSEQHYGNLPRSNHISNMPKYLEVGNSKSSCGVYYAKDFSGDKISKPDKFDQLPENPAVAFQRSEDGIKNDNVNVHARLPRSALVFNDPRDPRFADRAQNSFPYQNNTMAYKNYVRSEYSYQGYNAQGRYEYPHVPHGVSGFQRNDLNQYSHRATSQQPPNCGSDQFLPHTNNSFIFDSHCQQPTSSENVLSQQFCNSKNHSSTSLIQLDSTASGHHSVDVRLDRPLEIRKPNNIETIRAEDINKNGNSKISPLRLLRKKKFVNQKNETVLESIPASNIPADTVPTLDVRKFWSTWAEEEEENVPTQMVVLDCQTIDPEQAKFFNLYEGDPARAVDLESGGVVTVKGSSCDKDSSSQLAQFSAESQKVNIGFDQVSLLNEPKLSAYPVIGKQAGENKVEVIQQDETFSVRKSLEGNSKVEALDTPGENGSSKPATEVESPVEMSIESVDQKTEIMSPKNDGKPCKRGRSRASQENKESNRNKKTNLDKKLDKVNRLDKWTEKKFDFLKRAEESKAAEILRHEEEKKKIFERRLSFQQGNTTGELKKIPSSKTPKEKLEIADKEAKSFTNLDFAEEKRVVNEVMKSLSPFDDNSISNSSEDSKGDFPHLPTSEYRRNKFLDYSEKKLCANNSFSAPLENVKDLELGSNDENLGSENTNVKVNEDCVLSKSHHSLPVSEIEEIKKEKIIKQECLTSNNWPSSETYLTEKLSNNIFHSPLDGSLIDNIKHKGESGLHSFVMEDILKKISEINFQNPEVKVENIENDDILNMLKNEVVLEKTKKPNKRIKKNKKLEQTEENDERTDKLTVENISVSKPTIKFSIQKSHDLKISFKVLNSSKKYEKCESDEDVVRKEVEGKSDSVDESKNSTELITLKLKSVQRDGSNCDRNHKISKKIPFSRNGAMLKRNRRRCRRKKIRGTGVSPLKTPVLKIKKSRYLLQEEERDPLAEDTDYEKCLNLSRKPCSDEYSTSDDFQVQETIDSAKIKLTFKRHRTNFETEYKINNNDEEDDDDDYDEENTVEESQKGLEPEGQFKVVEFDSECSNIAKTRFKKKSKRKKHREIFDEASVESFKCHEEIAKETLEPNVDSDFESFTKEGQFESVPEEGFVNSASLQDLFGEDENYNLKEEEQESTSRISPRALSGLPLTVSSFESHGSNERDEEAISNFPDGKSICSPERESVEDKNKENVSTGSENLVEDNSGDFLVKSKLKVKVNTIGACLTNEDSCQKELGLIEVDLNRVEDIEGVNKCKNNCSGGSVQIPEGDETLREYSSNATKMGGATDNLTLPEGNSEKETNFEGIDIQRNNEEISLDYISTCSQESGKQLCFDRETNFESDKNDSSNRTTRGDSFEDLDNNIDGINYREEKREISDDNNNNKDDNAKQLICSGQRYEKEVEDENSSDVESIDSSTNQINHSKNINSSYESEADKNKRVVKSYSTDSSINYYCYDEKGREMSTEGVTCGDKDSYYAEREAFSEKDKFCDWKSYSNSSLISAVDDDLNDNASNQYELEANRLFDQVDSLLTLNKNFNQEDTEIGSRDSLNGERYSERDRSTEIIGGFDASEKLSGSEYSEVTKSEDAEEMHRCITPGDELYRDEVPENSREKIEEVANVSSEWKDPEKAKSPREIGCLVENDSLFTEKTDESRINERYECLNEQEKNALNEDDGSTNIDTPDLYSSPLSLKSVNQSEDNSGLCDGDNTTHLQQMNVVESSTSCESNNKGILGDAVDSLKLSDSEEKDQLLGTNLRTEKSLSLVETIFTGCETEKIDENCALGTCENSVFDFLSELNDNQGNSSHNLEKDENFSNGVPESYSNDKDLGEREIVEGDDAECFEGMPTKDKSVRMGRNSKSVEKETKPHFDLRNPEDICANSIASFSSEETETSADAMIKNSEDFNGKHESQSICFDIKFGNDSKIKNSCRYFLEKLKFDKSKIVRRRHSLKFDTLEKLNSSEKERNIESQDLKFGDEIPPARKCSKILNDSKRNSHNLKARSCPPSLRFFNKNDYQMQIAVLDISIENIPLPSGDPPPENCFNFEEYFKKFKIQNETNASESELDPELNKPTEKNQLEEDRTDPLIDSPMNDTELMVEDLNTGSKQPITLKEDIFQQVSSSVNCQSPFMLSDLISCRNPSPPLFREILSAKNHMECSKDDSKTEISEDSSKVVEFSSMEVKSEDSSATKSEGIDWSPLKSDEAWKITELVDQNMDSSTLSSTPVQLISEADTAQLSLHESIAVAQEIYDGLIKSPVQGEINFQNVNLIQKIQAFSPPRFSNPVEITPENNNQNSDGIGVTEEKYLKEKEHETAEITDSGPEKNKKENESEVLEDKNCAVSENENKTCVNSLSSETDEIQNDYEKTTSLKLICEDVDMEEIELRDLDSKTVDVIDDESLNVLGFENDDYIRNDFYECEDIPTSEDLPNGDENEDDKVSDDDKFRNIMQNCLDNAKKFLNEGNLKLFSGSVDDLLELDCQMTSENEPEKSTADSTNHISRDVLLTSCEDTVTDDLGLSEKFQPEDLSMDFVPSFCSDGSNNLCPEILPVDNWPYLEEEVPLSPSKAKQDETDLLPFLENVTDGEKIPNGFDEVKDVDESQDAIPPHANNGSFHPKKKTLRGVKCNADKMNHLKSRRMSFPGLENSNFKRFRRKSLFTEGETIRMRSRITRQRRKTIDSFTTNDCSGEMSSLKNEVDTMANLRHSGKSLKCRLSLEKLRSNERYEGKYKNLLNTPQENESECGFKEIKMDSREGKSLKSVENSKKSDFGSGLEPTSTISLKRKNFPKYKTSSWQPKVMLSRISQKELKRIRGNSNLESQLAKDKKISSKKNATIDFLKEKPILKEGFENLDSQECNSRPAFKKHRPNSFSEDVDFEQDADLRDFSEIPRLYVMPESKDRAQYIDGQVEGQKNNCHGKLSTSALDKHSFESHKLERPIQHSEKENHRGSRTSCKAHEMRFDQEKVGSPLSNSIDTRKHKKSRFRNLYSSKKSEPRPNLSPLANSIGSPAQNILPLDDPKLVDAERVLSEIFRDCDPPKNEVLNNQEKSIKTLLLNNKSEDESVKKKSSVSKDETTRLVDKKSKNSCAVDSPKNTEDKHSRVNSKNSQCKQSHSSGVSTKTEKMGSESLKGYSQISNKPAKELSKHRRSESFHSHKDDKKEIHEKHRSKHEEKKEEKCEPRERHKSDSERHNRYEKKREKHEGAKDCRKEISKHSRHETNRENNDALPSSKSVSKDRHSDSKYSKGFVRKNEETRSKGLSETEEKEKCRSREYGPHSPWMCEVCGFNDADERIAHIKTHPFHCQSCHLAFKTESYFINHLTKKHKDIRNQHHCLLCELSFDTEEQYQRHLETREHTHLESVEKNTINTLFTLLTGQPCPVLGLVEMKPEWLPNQAGTVHFYHQATPLSLALQYLKMHHDLSSSSTASSAHLN